MVQKVLTMLGREISGLHEAAYLLGAFAIGSQLLALIRDRLFAANFGASRTLDLYYAAFRIPDFIFVSIASLVSISVLVPFFIEKLREGEASGRRFVDSVFSLFFLVIVIVIVIVFIAMPYLVPFVLPGFSAEPLKGAVVELSRILLLSPFLLGLSNFLASITQLYNRFFLYALSPILYNLGIILGVVVFYPLAGLTGLAWGVVLGAVLHLLIQVPFILQKGLLPRFGFWIDWGAVRRVVFTSLPRTLTLSSNHIATFFLIALASFMGAGSIAVFTFAWNLQSVPLSIIGASYASAAFPALARLIAEGARGKFVEQIAASARHILFWSLPVTILFIVLRAQIVRTVLGAGEFGWSDTRLTAAALAMFIISVAAQGLLLLFIRGYYALGKTWKPLLINVASSALIVVFGYWFMHLHQSAPVFRFFLESLFKVENLSGSAVLVLPLAYTLGTLVNAVWHFLALRREFPAFGASVWRTFFTSGSAAVIMGYVAYQFLNVFSKVFDTATVVGIFLQGFFAGLLGIAAGVLVLVLMKNEEIRDVWRILHRKIWKARVLGTDPADL